ILLPNSRAPASGSPPCNASFTVTAAGSGPKARSIAVPPSTSPCGAPDMELRPDLFREKRILLVEDNPKDEALTLRALQKHNLQSTVVVMRDGVEALDYLLPSDGEAEPLPHLVLLDLKLPKVDGLEVLRRLRGHERTRMLPVVILTSSGEERDIL